ncbi:MAG TPA: hypothetical protein PKL31_07875 [Fulvivirga sp.]|nr:hypothetical protein [Fulvivirga sp.]
MIKKHNLLLIYMVTIALSCSTSKKANTEGQDKSMDYKELAQKKLGEKVSYLANTDSTFMLCVTNKSDDGVKYIQFFVFDLRSNEIIYEPKRRMRKVAWVSSNEIRADILTGMPVNEGTDDYIIYNVNEKKMTKSPNN